MRKFVLDTNLYVRAIRSVGAAEELKQYYDKYTPITQLSSIVLHELLVGASTAAKARDIQTNIARPFKRTGRMLAPSADAWEVAADAIARMARRDKRELRTFPKSLVNDFLLAASCREAGATLITDNTADFEAIRRYIRVSFQGPWPA